MLSRVPYPYTLSDAEAFCARPHAPDDARMLIVSHDLAWPMAPRPSLAALAFRKWMASPTLATGSPRPPGVAAMRPRQAMPSSRWRGTRWVCGASPAGTSPTIPRRAPSCASSASGRPGRRPSSLAGPDRTGAVDRLHARSGRRRGGSPGPAYRGVRGRRRLAGPPPRHADALPAGPTSTVTPDLIRGPAKSAPPKKRDPGSSPGDGICGAIEGRDRLFARSECGRGGSAIAAWERPALTDRVIHAQAGIQTG